MWFMVLVSSVQSLVRFSAMRCNISSGSLAGNFAIKYVHGVDAHVCHALCAFIDPADNVLLEEDIAAEHGLGDGRLRRVKNGLSRHIRVVALVPGVHEARELLLIIMWMTTKGGMIGLIG
jgi:hypothetical protein